MMNEKLRGDWCLMVLIYWSLKNKLAMYDIYFDIASAPWRFIISSFPATARKKQHLLAHNTDDIFTSKKSWKLLLLRAFVELLIFAIRQVIVIIGLAAARQFHSTISPKKQHMKYTYFILRLLIMAWVDSSIRGDEIWGPAAVISHELMVCRLRALQEKGQAASRKHDRLAASK